MSAFQSEQELAQAVLNRPAFLASLGYSEWTTWQRQELEGLFGIPDLVVAFTKVTVSGQKVVRTFAFEFKKSNWRRALVQAFRYASFAHYSCVLMDAHFVHRALKHLEEFQRANIGLASVSDSGDVRWHCEPIYSQPYSEPLRRKLESQVALDLP